MNRDRLIAAATYEICGIYKTRKNLINEIKAASYNNEVTMQGAKHLVDGGCFLVYYSDVTDWLHANGGDRRIKNDERNWNIYVDLIARTAYKLAKGREESEVYNEQQQQ